MSEQGFWARSIYGMKTKQPLVDLRHRDWALQVTPEEARSIAHSILEAAEASETDAFLIDWVKREVQADEESAARLLFEFRQFREQRRKDAGTSL